MMMYVAHVTYWDEDKEGLKTTHCFVPAVDYRDVTITLTEYFGENAIDKMELEAFSPEEIMVFDEDNDVECDIFNNAYRVLQEKVCWQENGFKWVVR